MRFCPSHWDALRTAIDTRGLGHLVASNGREAVARRKAELEASDDVSDVDPLMAAHNMILAQCTEALGLYLYAGEYCPVCEILKVYPPIPDGHRYASNESYFIDGPADAVLAMCQQLGIATPLRSSELAP